MKIRRKKEGYIDGNHLDDNDLGVYTRALLIFQKIKQYYFDTTKKCNKTPLSNKWLSESLVNVWRLKERKTP